MENLRVGPDGALSGLFDRILPGSSKAEASSASGMPFAAICRRLEAIIFSG